MKDCNKCLDRKSLIDFPKRSSSKDGYRNTCKICTNNYMKERYKNEEIKQLEKIKSNKWYLNNKDYAKNKTKEYKRLSRQKVEIKLRDNLRSRLNSSIKGNYKSGSAVQDLGCTIEELKTHIESNFKEGMTWDNWGKTTWHIDHKIALARFDLSSREELLKACHYTNLQPLWAKDNWVKGC